MTPVLAGVRIHLRRAAPRDRTLEELAAQSGRTSPAFGALATPVPVTIEVERAT